MGATLEVQWLILGTSVKARVRSLVGKLRSRVPCGVAKKKKNPRSYYVVSTKITLHILFISFT